MFSVELGEEAFVEGFEFLPLAVADGGDPVGVGDEGAADGEEVGFLVFEEFEFGPGVGDGVLGFTVGFVHGECDGDFADGDDGE